MLSTLDRMPVYKGVIHSYVQTGFSNIPVNLTNPTSHFTEDVWDSNIPGRSFPAEGKEEEKLSGNGMAGEGLDVDTLIKVVKVIPQVTKYTGKLLFGSVGTNLSNSLHSKYSKNKEWKKGFNGEKHLFLPTKKGLTRGNWIGPGTKVIKRAERGDLGVDGPKGVDIAAKRHDLRYTLAESKGDLKAADKAFMKDIRHSSQSTSMKNVLLAGMKAKRIGEKIGFLPKTQFAPHVDEIEKSKESIPIGQGLRRKVSRNLKKDRVKKKEYKNEILTHFSKNPRLKHFPKTPPKARKRKGSGLPPKKLSKAQLKAINSAAKVLRRMQKR